MGYGCAKPARINQNQTPGGWRPTSQPYKARGAALTIPPAGSPGSHRVVENPIHPDQKPAYTKAQQKSQHQINLLLRYIVSHKVILRGVHH